MLNVIKMGLERTITEGLSMDMHEVVGDALGGKLQETADEWYELWHAVVKARKERAAK